MDRPWYCILLDMNIENILVILLSITLIIFLIVAIVFFYHLIKISRNVQSLTEKVDDAAQNMVSASNTLRGMAAPMAISSIIGNLAEKFVKSTRRKSHDKKSR